MRAVFQPKLLSDVRTYVFDFSSLLGVGESVASAVCSCFVYSGTDPLPSSVLNGAASVATPLVYQSLTGGVLGTVYEIKCLATTSGGILVQNLTITAFLVVLPDLV